MDAKRKVPDRDTLAKQLETMSIDEIALAAGVGRRAVRLHLTRYNLIACRTTAVRLEEARSRAAAAPQPKKNDIVVRGDRVTITVETYVPGKGFQLRPRSYPRNSMFIANLAERFPQLKGDARA